MFSINFDKQIKNKITAYHDELGTFFTNIRGIHIYKIFFFYNHPTYECSSNITSDNNYNSEETKDIKVCRQRLIKYLVFNIDIFQNISNLLTLILTKDIPPVPTRLLHIHTTFIFITDITT